MSNQLGSCHYCSYRTSQQLEVRKGTLEYVCNSCTRGWNHRLPEEVRSRIRVAAAKQRILSDPARQTRAQREETAHRIVEQRDYNARHCDICAREMVPELGRVRRPRCPECRETESAKKAAAKAAVSQRPAKPKSKSKQNSKYPFAKSVSVRAWQGGAPGLGKRS